MGNIENVGDHSHKKAVTRRSVTAETRLRYGIYVGEWHFEKGLSPSTSVCICQCRSAITAYLFIYHRFCNIYTHVFKFL